MSTIQTPGQNIKKNLKQIEWNRYAKLYPLKHGISKNVGQFGVQSQQTKYIVFKVAL